MRQLVADGSFFDVGCKVGTVCKEDILAVYDRMQTYLLEHTSVGSKERMHEVAQRHMAEAESLWAPSVEFLRGLAKGADVPIETIALTAFSEEVSSEFLPASGEKCSTLVVRMPNGNHLIIHNEDYEPYYLGNMVLLRAAFDDFPELVSLTYPGQLPGLAGSLNRRGIAITNNGLWPAAQPGLPKQVQHFRASLASTLQEAEDWLTRTPIAVTTHYVVACSQTREIISLTVSNPETAFAPIVFSDIDGQSFCHTNHVPKGSVFQLREPDPATVHSKHSFYRYDKLSNLTPEQLPKTPAEALDLFSTNDGLIHRTPEQNPNSVTLATIVICPETRDLWIRDADLSAVKRDWRFLL